ncbi:MAG: hypothetical protein DYG88_05300 [Chloroflexi bacterium CFX4]|nr:hypothetical protein [Chloroflexi bacterium CFX4]MDL1924005.1 hypothetical protein [Chloroflexi bacterium CFX3]
MSSIRETMNIGALRQRQQMHRRQVRYFAMAWTGITLLLGAATFIAVYAATGALAAELPTGSSILPPPAAENGVVVAQITATPFPTFPPPDQAQPTQEPPPPIVITATPSVLPTVAPIRDLDFDLGIAVQKNADPNVYGLWVAMARDQLRLNWVKSQVVWRDTEKVKGQIDWSDLDTSLTLLSDAGVKVLLSITKAPDWARDPGARIVADVNDGPPANPQDYADFLSALLRRYPGKIHAIEVWNEINIDREWTTNPPAINAQRYVQLLQVAYSTIKSIDPNIIVISAGLAPTGANIPGAVTDDFVYMDQLIAAGLLNTVDCVGAHHNGLNVPPNQDWNNLPERNPPARFRGPWSNPHHSWAFKSTLEGYANRIRAAGSDKKLCVTEFGWPSVEDLQGRGQLRDGFGFAADNTLQDQANFTVQAIELMQQWGFVRLAMIWNLNYGAQAGWNIGGAVGDNVPWSILGPDFQPRPVWQRIVDLDFRSRPRREQ